MNASSRRLLDLWLPPEGAGRALGCIATTFTFDADFFEQQCIGRFLGLDTRPGEAASDIGYLIEREEKLAETPVCVVADRSLNPDSRSLRWDILGVGAPTGVMHAKVSLLVWEHVVRVITTSANLSERAYRSSIELAIATDATDGGELPQQVFDDLLGSLERIVRLAPGASRADGPRARTLESLASARERIVTFGLPNRARRGAAKLETVATGTGRDALDGLMRTWSGGPPRWATVMSPFFDTGESPSRAAKRLVEVLSKRGAAVEFIVPVDHLGERETIQVPRALLDAFPGRVEVGLFDVNQPNEGESRRLHGKLILLESEAWVSALVGSSNFSAPGLGLGGGGNLEVGLAIGAPAGSAAGNDLVKLALRGEEIAIEQADFEAETDPEERVLPIPAGFLQALGDPGPPAVIEFELEAELLPEEWWARTPDGHELLDSASWTTAGRNPLVKVSAPTGELPFNVTLQWRGADGVIVPPTNLPLNVTDPARLPPPEELRSLPLDAILRALASVRPLHEAVVEALQRRERSAARASHDDEIDSLKRFSPSGQILYRTRELSAALVGLRERLERPAASVEAFLWRLEGPFGPTEIATKLIEERRTNRSIPGEEPFMLAEIGLTLANVNLEAASRFIPEQRPRMRRAVRATIRSLAKRCADAEAAPSLQAYVEDAFRRALK
jgi:phosphatidylserine/phosphatidylglycerophosphate/cardiolipin synthase-like enzyme